MLWFLIEHHTTTTGQFCGYSRQNDTTVIMPAYHLQWMKPVVEHSTIRSVDPFARLCKDRVARHGQVTAHSLFAFVVQVSLRCRISARAATWSVAIVPQCWDSFERSSCDVGVTTWCSTSLVRPTGLQRCCWCSVAAVAKLLRLQCLIFLCEKLNELNRGSDVRGVAVLRGDSSLFYYSPFLLSIAEQRGMGKKTAMWLKLYPMFHVCPIFVEK